MATPSAVRSVHPTLNGTGVDTVTLEHDFAYLEITNREAAGGATLWYRVATRTTPMPEDPVAASNDCGFVLAGTSVLEPIETSGPGVVKVVGNGNQYSVCGVNVPKERK